MKCKVRGTENSQLSSTGGVLNSELTGKNVHRSLLFLISPRPEANNLMKNETPEQVFPW